MNKVENIILIPIDKIFPNDKNPNSHSKEQIDRLVKVIKYSGFRAPLVVSKRSGKLIVGHGRLEAAKKLGLKELPVSYQDFDDEDMEYQHMVADNAMAEWSSLDLSAINSEIANFDPCFDIETLGLKNFVIDPADKIPMADEDDVPENVDTRCKLGDLWELGQHRLMCGDSTSIDAVDKLMDDNKADMVFTDPPYNMETRGGGLGKKFEKTSERIKDIVDFEPEEFLSILLNVFKEKTQNAYIFCNKDLVVKYLNYAVNNGFSYNILIWKKPNPIPFGDSHRPDIEYLILIRKNAIWNNGLDVNYSRVLEFNKEDNKEDNKDHPTKKPVELIQTEILISSNKGSIVFDPFCGSGSTLIACEKTNRKCYAMELDPNYASIIIDRWEKYTGLQAKLVV